MDKEKKINYIYMALNYYIVLANLASKFNEP